MRSPNHRSRDGHRRVVVDLRTRLELVGLALLVGLVADGCTQGKQENSATAAEEPAIAAKVELWDGVPPLVSEAADLMPDLQPQEGPKPPTSVNERIALPFPPAIDSSEVVPEVAAGALEVLRYGPTGAQGAVDSISVAFNQPMVPLAAVESLRQEQVPLQIEPATPGEIRWLGTRALAFRAEGRLPFSTTYRVKVPAGTRSTQGSELARAIEWSFKTPTLELEASSPAKGTKDAELGAPIVLRFNQKIRREELVAAGLWLRGGGTKIALRAIPEGMWGSLEGDAASLLQGADRDRVLCLRASERLRPNTRYSLQIPAGSFGEGADASVEAKLTFSTYPPPGITGTNCAPEGCSPSYPLMLRTTTPLQASPTDLAELVTISPQVEGLEVSAGGGLQIRAQFLGAANYTVTVKPGLQDIYGQTIETTYRGTIKTAPYEPQLGVPDGYFDPVVVERKGPQRLPLRVAGVTSIEIRSRALSPEEFGDLLGNRWFDVEQGWPSAAPPAVDLRTIRTPESKRRPQRLELDLGELISPGKVLYLAGRTSPFNRWGYRERLGLNRFVEVTDIGITAAFDRDGGTLLVTSLDSGEPLAGVELELRKRSSRAPLWRGRSDASGLATLHRAGGVDEEGFLVARAGDDIAILPLDRDISSSWWGSEAESQPRAFFYSDREPYKPGETVHLNGIVRREIGGPGGGIGLWRSGAAATYSVSGPRGQEVAKGELRIGDFGTFSVDVPLAKSADLGGYWLNVKVKSGLFGDGHSFSHGFTVASYRTPEFEVAVGREEAAPLVFGDVLRAELRGSYVHGAPLAGGAVSYTIRRQRSGFHPPGAENKDFTFGEGRRGVDLWRSGKSGEFGGLGYPGSGGSAGVLVAKGSGSLDSRGIFVVEHNVVEIEAELGAAKSPPRSAAKGSGKGPLVLAASYTIEASVTDQNRQSIAARETFVVHPALRYIGLRSDREVYRVGERARAEAVVVDLAGVRIPEIPLSIELVREQTRRHVIERDGRWVYDYTTEEIAAGGCAPISSSAVATCDLELGAPGTYILRASVHDGEGRKQESRRRFYVYGEDGVVWDQPEQRVDVVADRRIYEPGDRATLLVRAPFDRARGLLVLERDGVLSTEPLQIEGGAASVEVPIEESMIPNLHVAVVLDRGRIDVPGAPPGQDLGRPAYAFGATKLEISPESKRIVVEVAPEREVLAPKETLRLRLRTKTRDGEALPTALAVMVVDEGVLSLMGYETPDPLSFFHRQRAPGARIFDLRASLLRRALEQSSDKKGAVEWNADGAEKLLIGGAYLMTKESDKESGGAYRVPQEPGGGGGSDVALRTLFASTAYFNPEVMTDALGEAVIEIPMPDNLTAFRIMVVAVDPAEADRFGSGDARVRVRKPIMIRPSLPRFANYGDRFEAAVMVDNQTEDAQAVEVGVRGLGVAIRGEDRSTVEIPAGESRELRFPMAVEGVGQARLQFAALAKGGRDATEVTFPLLVPATRQAFADYGITEGSVARIIKAPMEALSGFGGLELSLSSTALGGLEDATRFLLDYDYECSEQSASRLLPIFVLGPILDGFSGVAKGADRDRRATIAKQGIARLLGRQNRDGGFRLWDTAGRSWPYVSAWVTFALLEGKKAGFAVDERALTKALLYLEKYIRRSGETPYGRTYDWSSRAFALWLLSRENRGAELFDAVWSHREDLPLYAQAWMLSAAHRYRLGEQSERLRQEISRQVIEDAKSAHFVEAQSEAFAEGLQLLMHSSVQTDAIILMALLEVAPADPLLPKVMAGIMEARDPKAGGRWPTTHANAWALLAADRYYKTVENVVPDFVAQVFLGDEFAGAQEFRGRSLAVTQQSIPMRTLQKSPERLLTLAKEGPGKLYYRIGLRYAPADLSVAAEDQGFEVHRNYQAVAQGQGPVDPSALRRLDDGSWEVKAGTLVRVDLTLVVRDRASYVVVDDPLPAGFEGQNSSFQTTLQDVSASPAAEPASDAGGGSSPWWRRYWRWDHVELRDDRLLLFADRLPAGVYTYSYIAQATTLGEFVLPPVHAEGMYTPERFGHSASSVVRVVESRL